MMQDMCILVVSCDKYADCWTPFSDCMRKFWPDCPYPVYLCTESGEPENGAVYSKVFHEQTQIWTARVRKACEKIKESHILVVLEDQWLFCCHNGCRELLYRGKRCRCFPAIA